MCGIAGIFNLDKSPISSVSLKKMTDVLAHRGPDGEGLYVDNFIGLAHRRLAIIDLSLKAHQPMLTRNGQYAITYNGEVYNFRELMVELENLGYKFKSRSDSEVVLYAYAQWGVKCLDRFNGMFAFAIWDKKNAELFLARDRYGIKPLYYTFSNNSFLFASEHKALLKLPGVRQEVDKEGLLEYFTFQNIFTNRTLLKGISIFPAGSWAKVSLKDAAKHFSPVQYWDFDFREPEHPLSEQDYIIELNRLFQQAVKRQLVSDVGVGSYLSGGMDSGSIVAVAAKYIPGMKTFTCGFDLSSANGLELGFDERHKARQMAELFKTGHYETVLKSGDMELVLPKLAWHLEEPRVGQSYPNYYAAKLAAQSVKVVLSGVGGDELFGGYPWRYYRVAANENFNDYIDKYYRYWHRLIPAKEMIKIFGPIWRDVQHVDTRNIFCNVFRKRKQSQGYVNQSLYFEAKTFLHGLLIVEDKLSMAHRLETRVPFLDNDLVDFAQALPVSLKLRKLSEVKRIDENKLSGESKYFERTNHGKIILRKAMQKYIPDSISNGEKQGFSAPDASWFKGESIEYVRKNLLLGNPLIYEYMDRQEVKKLIEEHLSGRQNRRLFIWSLLNVEQWLKNNSTGYSNE
jgi:asparagine synthase (glutamine-hydrolysing)